MKLTSKNTLIGLGIIILLALVFLGIYKYTTGQEKIKQQQAALKTDQEKIDTLTSQNIPSDPDTTTTSTGTVSGTKPKNSSGTTSAPVPPKPASAVSMATYTNSQYGLSFQYPSAMKCMETSSHDSSPDQNVLHVGICCGDPSINGSVTNSNGGCLLLDVDNGNSKLRTNLENSILPSSAKTIGSNTFYGNIILKPTYVLTIGAGAGCLANYINYGSNNPILNLVSCIDLRSLKLQ